MTYLIMYWKMRFSQFFSNWWSDLLNDSLKRFFNRVFDASRFFQIWLIDQQSILLHMKQRFFFALYEIIARFRLKLFFFDRIIDLNHLIIDPNNVIVVVIAAVSRTDCDSVNRCSKRPLIDNSRPDVNVIYWKWW